MAEDSAPEPKWRVVCRDYQSPYDFTEMEARRLAAQWNREAICNDNHMAERERKRGRKPRGQDS